MKGASEEGINKEGRGINSDNGFGTSHLLSINCVTTF